jgi:hypothetical protein
VAPVTPGFETYQVFPQMAPLQHIKTTVPSVKGDINLELSDDGETFTMALTSPPATTAVIGIPRREGATISTIEANGRCVWQDGQPESGIEGLAFAEVTPYYVAFTVQPGRWEFKAALPE